MNDQIITLIAKNKDVAVCRLMDAIREVIEKPEYSDVMISTIIGVLEMVKLEQYGREES